jgi:DNA-binding XRE family transcriptional regulator
MGEILLIRQINYLAWHLEKREGGECLDQNGSLLRHVNRLSQGMAKGRTKKNRRRRFHLFREAANNGDTDGSKRISLHYPHCGICDVGRGNSSVDKKEFSNIRRQLGKTQSQMAELLGTSLKAVQSFEQGWRKIPVHVERQVLFLLAQKVAREKQQEPCWSVEKCPMDTRKNCPAWEFQSGYLCWFINGTICHGEAQKSWHEKIEMCRKCKVFRSILPRI